MSAASWAGRKAVLLALVLLEGICLQDRHSPTSTGHWAGLYRGTGSHKKLELVGAFLVSKRKIAALTGPLKISGS